MFPPKLWSALGETVGNSTSSHLVGVRFFQCGRSLLGAASARCRTSSFLPRLRSIPILRRRKPPAESGSNYQGFCRARALPQGFRRLCSIPAEEMRLASDWSGLANRPGGQRFLPKRYVVPIGLDPGWFPGAGLPPLAKDSGSGFRRCRDAAWWFVSGGSTSRGARPSGPCLCPDRGRLRRRCIWFSPDRAIEDYVRKVKRWLEQGAVLEDHPHRPAFRRRPFYGIAAGGTLCAAFLHGKLSARSSAEAMGEWRARRNFRSGEHLAGNVRAKGRAGGALRCECDRAGAAPTARTIRPSPANWDATGAPGWPKHLPWNVVGAAMIRVYEKLFGTPQGDLCPRRSGGLRVKVDVPERWLRLRPAASTVARVTNEALADTLDRGQYALAAW